MTNSNITLNEARNALHEMQKKFDNMRVEAIKKVVYDMIETGKEMTRRDICAATELTMAEVERYIDGYVYRNYYPHDRNPLIATKKRLCRKYALINENGSIDRDTTVVIPTVCWTYKARPEVKIDKDDEPTYKEVFAEILDNMK